MWSTLVEIFSFIKKKKQKKNFCGFIVQPCVVRGLLLFIQKTCSFIVQTCVVRRLPTLDQIFSFFKKTKGYFQGSFISLIKNTKWYLQESFISQNW